MHYYQKTISRLQINQKYFGYIPIILLAIFLVLACHKDPVPDPEKNPDPDQQKDPTPVDSTATTDADELSEYLIMTGETKIEGALPPAADGGLKINVKDTAYTVMGMPVAAARFFIKKPPGLEIESFNVQVEGASHYYNVPAENPQEGVPMEADTLRLLVLDLQTPDDIALPLTLDITIQALSGTGEATKGTSGEPIDEFEKAITEESLLPPAGSPLAPNPCPGQHPQSCGALPNWLWAFTSEKFTNTIIYPEKYTLSPPWITTGCCKGGDISVFEFQDPFCRPDGNNLEYKELEVRNTGSMQKWTMMGLYEGGQFYISSGKWVSNIDGHATNFCEGIVRYIQQGKSGLLGGTHDYNDGDSFINLTFDPALDTGGYRPFFAGELVYTWHNLLIIEPDPEGGDLLERIHLFIRFDAENAHVFWN